MNFLHGTVQMKYGSNDDGDAAAAAAKYKM